MFDFDRGDALQAEALQRDLRAIHPYPVERPTAAEVRTQTLHLADRVGGQQLAVLAPKTVPTLMAQRQHRLSRLPLPRVAPITLTGTVLVPVT